LTPECKAAMQRLSDARPNAGMERLIGLLRQQSPELYAANREALREITEWINAR
jgi:hypothetical protein